MTASGGMSGGFDTAAEMRDDYRVYGYSGEVIKVRGKIHCGSFTSVWEEE